MTPTAHIDHLVIAAASLDAGVQWCEHTLGVPPGPGGRHPLMSTHNRLLSLACPAHPCAYLEIIAIDSEAHWPTTTRATRWFDLDTSDVQHALHTHGPRLIHFVASTPSASAGVQALAALGLDRGPLIEASRTTPSGLLAWHITVRDDGQRLLQGLLPTLIEWQGQHPTQTMPASGITLQSLSANHLEDGWLRSAYRALGLTAVDVSHGAADLMTTLNTPRGLVTLATHGL